MLSDTQSPGGRPSQLASTSPLRFRATLGYGSCVARDTCSPRPSAISAGSGLTYPPCKDRRELRALDRGGRGRARDGRAFLARMDVDNPQREVPTSLNFLSSGVESINDVKGLRGPNVTRLAFQCDKTGIRL